MFLQRGIVYNRTYLPVRRHKNQNQVLQVQQVAQAVEIEFFSSFIKSTVSLLHLCLVVLVCYLPYLISFFSVVTEVNGPRVVLKRFSLFSITLAYLDSSLNPVIYCWKMRHIRHAVINIFWNISRHRSRESHETLALVSHTLHTLHDSVSSLLLNALCI